MNLVFYGNCQVEAASYALQARNPSAACTYAGNSNRVPKFDPARSEKLMNAADAIIAQPVMNMDRKDNHEALRQRFGDRVIFMPYIFVRGLHSLSLAGPTHRKLALKNLIGGDIVLPHLRRHGFHKTVAFYKAGRIDFQHQARFQDTLTEMRRREDQGNCEIRIADEIEKMRRDSQVMLTHNHPSPDLINIIAGKIAGHLGLDFSDIPPEETSVYTQITLPVFETIVTPSCKADLGLTYPYDLQWFYRGRGLIRTLAETYSIETDS